MSRSQSSSTSDDNNQTQEQQQLSTPAANPAGLEERVTKLEQQLQKLMPRIEALTGPL